MKHLNIKKTTIDCLNIQSHIGAINSVGKATRMLNQKLEYENNQLHGR